jgi:hypothetical protein
MSSTLTLTRRTRCLEHIIIVNQLMRVESLSLGTLVGHHLLHKKLTEDEIRTRLALCGKLLLSNSLHRLGKMEWFFGSVEATF